MLKLSNNYPYSNEANVPYRKDGAPTNPRGIPNAPFVDKVEDYVTSRADVETTLKSFQEMISCVATGPIPAINKSLPNGQKIPVYGIEYAAEDCWIG